MIAALLVAIVMQFDTPIRSVLITVGDRISLLLTGSSLGYGG